MQSWYGMLLSFSWLSWDMQNCCGEAQSRPRFKLPRLIQEKALSTHGEVKLPPTRPNRFSECPLCQQSYLCTVFRFHPELKRDRKLRITTAEFLAQRP